MSKLTDFAATQKAYNDRLTASLEGISGDIATLNDTITQLQSTSGAITAEDQALLDQLQAQGEALAASMEGVDALTPPAVPGAPTDPNQPTDPNLPVV